MKEKKAISMGKLAAMERQWALGLTAKRPAISVFEQEARDWQRKENASDSRNQAPILSPDPVVPSKPQTDVLERHGEIFGEEAGDVNAHAPSAFQGVTAETMAKIHHSENNHASRDKADETKEGFHWEPLQPPDSRGQKKEKDLNTASVALIARKIMAREWAAALGRPRNNRSNESILLKEAEKQHQEERAKKEKKETEKKRASRQRKYVEMAIHAFAHELLKTPKPMAPEMAEPLLEEAFSDVGNIISFTWQEKGCCIFLEPWEEKRMRRKQGQMAPAVFQAVIDDNLTLGAYKRIENPEVLQEMQNRMISNSILASFKASNQHHANVMEDAVSEAGRIIQSTQTDGQWAIKLEPWEEMRKRNVERGGQPPVVTYMINATRNFEKISCNRL